MLFIRPGSERGCLSRLALRKVGLGKVVYPAWVGERLFIRPSSEESWSGKVVYPAWVGERLFIRPSSEESWSGKSCLSRLGR